MAKKEDGSPLRVRFMKRLRRILWGEVCAFHAAIAERATSCFVPRARQNFSASWLKNAPTAARRALNATVLRRGCAMRGANFLQSLRHMTRLRQTARSIV